MRGVATGPIPYMERTRDYYAALGYHSPYAWAHYDDTPFQRLRQPLARTRITLVTTAAPYQPDKGPQGAGAPYNAAAKFYTVYSGNTARDHDLRIAHVAIDRDNTSMEDSGTWFPLPLLRRHALTGRLLLAQRFHGFPTNRSQRHTLGIDAPELLARCVADGAGAALLVANCPVCHQSLALAARHLETHGISTVLLGCARDIVEHCGVPRFLFSDFPLGNAAGRPHDLPSQETTLDLALTMLVSANAARSTVQSPLRWGADDAWKLDYANAGRLTADEIGHLHAKHEAARLTARGLRAAVLQSD